jgi:hypothetical protein
MSSPGLGLLNLGSLPPRAFLARGRSLRFGALRRLYLAGIHVSGDGLPGRRLAPMARRLVTVGQMMMVRTMTTMLREHETKLVEKMRSTYIPHSRSSRQRRQWVHPRLMVDEPEEVVSLHFAVFL